MVVDAGNSMDQMYNDEMSRFKLALSCVLITLQQKVFYNPTHEVGFSIFGDNDGYYLPLQEIAKPDIDFLRKIDELRKARLDNNQAGGDLFAAIEAGVKQMEREVGKKKSKRRMFVFSSGAGHTNYQEEDIRFLAAKIGQLGIGVNVVPINFMDNYNMEENVIEESTLTDPQMIRNAELLMHLKHSAGEVVQIFPDDIAIELYQKFRKRDVNPVAIFRGDFTIGPGLYITVETFKIIRREKMKSLAKYNTGVAFDPKIAKGKEITTDVSYIIQGDETNSNIEADNRMNAYPYGPQLVPISGILEQDSKWKEERNFQLLGFVEKDKIPRESFMG